MGLFYNLIVKGDLSMFNEKDEWEMRDDARTLARAEEIKADKERYANATMMAGKMAEEEIKKAESIIKVAGKKVPKTPVEKPETQAFSKKTYSNPATVGKLF